MPTRYDALYYSAAPVFFPYLAWRWGRRRKYHESGPAMFGRRLSPTEAARFAGGSVWIHAVSVGEVAAARAMFPGLRELYPDRPFVISTITETGQASARETLPGADAHIYFPADFSWNVRHFLDTYRPETFILMETELWPNFLTLSAARGTRIVMMNAKLSDRSFPRYLQGLPLMAPVFRALSGVCVQTEIDRERFTRLGVPADRVEVTGNCKFDVDFPTLSPDERAAQRQAWGILPDQPVVVAGSTHRTEEALVLFAFQQLKRNVRNPCLILVPRHPERFGEVALLVQRRGMRLRRVSDMAQAPPPAGEPAEVILLDQMGMLARSYGLGDVAIVAGSFCRTGGHNLLEAAAHRLPVIYGPNMKSQRELARLFAAADAGTQVSEAGLVDALVSFFLDPDLRRREGEKAHAVLQANQGSARRNLDALSRWLAADRAAS
jgi:3-deoxy-D-manno-octulosonic-acid transferase